MNNDLLSARQLIDNFMVFMNGLSPEGQNIINTTATIIRNACALANSIDLEYSYGMVAIGLVSAEYQVKILEITEGCSE